jgi:hypothetical protein
MTYATKIKDDLNVSVTQYHAVGHCAKQLRDAGFTELRER